LSGFLPRIWPLERVTEIGLQQRGLNTERSKPVFFWLPRTLSNHMDRQARTGETVLDKSREMTGRSQTLPWWLGGGGVKTTEKSIGSVVL
jgi:hypothetical protein